nr:MAG TPA: hypothetical protein [Caudoviricetes sp.]
MFTKILAPERVLYKSSYFFFIYYRAYIPHLNWCGIYNRVHI